MSRTIGVREAKAHFSQVLDEVERGTAVTITKHGKPVARLVPVAEKQRRDINDVIGEMREIRARSKPLEGLTIRDLIEEGRRF
ncbi:MAG TPA: type II toxin-antitoxin system prevent-host-death family antitoxin [Chloroflexota bacterium]|nr:type II toxin-antitoxin system prevent-host-death family antitoxin [Chloroflexota bacterium]